MAQFSVRNLTFAYDGSYDNVFQEVNFSADTCWRLGLVGRNGRGKTTLLRLLRGELAHQGQIDMPLTPSVFPIEGIDAGQLTLYAMQKMAPDVPDWKLRREANLLELDEDTLYRPFETLSNGEQTKVQLAALFAREDQYPLLDEPTNHLDMHGRDLVGAYLSGKDGFLLVSHDRDFLNRCCSHILSINRADITVRKGDYDTFQVEMERQNQHERAENERLRKDIHRLGESARRTAQWSKNVEKRKYTIDRDSGAAYDKGYIGARSADMMKRSLSTVRRKERAMEEKSKLLKNVEKVGDIKLQPLRHPKQRLVEVREGFVRYDQRVVCENIHFTVERGSRVALVGANGTGKSSILKALCGLSEALEGMVSIAGGLRISYLPQSTQEVRGNFRTFLSENELDETLMKAILRNMDFGRQQFDKDLSELSQGQKKKILLAQSLMTPAHLYVWDEPLNYIDILSRRQVEELIVEYQPTMLLVEHDRAFLRAVDARVVELSGTIALVDQ